MSEPTTVDLKFSVRVRTRSGALESGVVVARATVDVSKAPWPRQHWLGPDSAFPDVESGKPIVLTVDTLMAAAIVRNPDDRPLEATGGTI